MRLRRVLPVLFVLGMIVLHHDLPLWNDRRLVGGILPIGLAYHALYSVLAALLMLYLVRNAWPVRDEEAP